MAQWMNVERVLAYAVAQPRQLVGYLARELDQAALDRIEAALAPELTADQKAAAIERAALGLVESGLSAEDGAVLALEAEAEKVRASEEQK